MDLPAAQMRGPGTKPWLIESRRAGMISPPRSRTLVKPAFRVLSAKPTARKA